MAMIFGARSPLSTQSQELSGIRLQTSLYGRIRPILYGTQRIGGNLIWYGFFYGRYVSYGKGGILGGLFSKGQPYNDYVSSVAIALCEGPIGGISNIWNSIGNLSLNNAQEEFTVPPGGGTYQVANYQTFANDQGCQREDTYSVVANDYGSPGPVTLSGTQLTQMAGDCSGAAGHYCVNTNSGTYTFYAGDAGKTILINYTYTPNTAANENVPLVTADFAYFNGSRPQDPWGFLVAKVPSQALNYSGLAYVACPSLDLGPSGMMPNLNFEVEGFIPGVLVGTYAGRQFFQQNLNRFDAEPSSVIADILTSGTYGLGQSGITPGITVAELADWSNYIEYCVSNSLFISLILDQQRQAIDWLRDILETTNAEAWWSGAQLKIATWGDTSTVGGGLTFSPQTQPVYDLDDDDFQFEEGSDPVLIERPTIQDAYNSIKIEFSNRGNNYNPEIVQATDDSAAAQYGLRIAPVKTMHWITSQATAALVAQTLLTRLLYIRNVYTFTLDARYILLEPMDLVTITDANLGLNQQPVRIRSVEEDDKGHLKFVAEEFPWSVSAPTAYPKQTVTPGGQNSLEFPGPINTPIMFEALSRLNNQIGHSIWFGLSGSNPNWGGCNVWISIDGGTTYKPAMTQFGMARMGVLTSALASTADPDTTDSFSVNLEESFGTLMSASEIETNNFATLSFLSSTLVVQDNFLSEDIEKEPPAAITIILRDSGGGLWKIGVTDAGLLTSTSVGSGSPQNIVLNDSGNSTSWNLGVTTGGLLTTTPATFSAGNPTAYLLISGDAVSFDLGVTIAGVLETTGVATIPVDIAAPSSYILQDSSTQKWQITIDDLGHLRQTPVASGTVNTIVLNDAGNAHSYQLGITTSGQLTTTLVTLGSYPSTLPLFATLNIWDIGVTAAGQITQTNIGNWAQVLQAVGGAGLFGASIVLDGSGNYESDGTGTAAAYWTESLFEADQASRAQFSFVNPSSPSQIGVAVRASSNGAAYVAYYSQGTVYLYVFTSAGTQTLLGSIPASPSVTNMLEVRAVGTTISALLNGNVIISATDSTIATGQPGIYASYSGSLPQPNRMTNWAGTELGNNLGELISYQDATLTSSYNYTLGTLLRRGIAGSEISAHATGSAFLRLDDNVNTYDYDPQLIGTTVFFKFTSFNLRQLQEEFLENVPAYPFTITGQSIGVLTPAHVTYRPTSNPLTAIDAGSSATIDIAAFSMAIPGINYPSEDAGSVTGLQYNTTYFVFYDDPTFTGGSVIYQVSTVKTDALEGAGILYVGSITTPVQGSGITTVGNGDGGAGAQIGTYQPIGLVAAILSGSQVGNGSVSNINNASNQDVTNPTVLSVSGDSAQNSITVEWTIPSGVTFTKAVVNIMYSVPTNTLTGYSGTVADTEFSVGAGAIWPSIVEAGVPLNTTTLQIPLPPGMNPADFYFVVAPSISNAMTGGSLDINVYQAWLQIIE